MSLPVPCIVSGCPRLTRYGSRCEAHTRNRWASSQATDYGSRWRYIIRPQVLAEEPSCRACGRPTEIIDHRLNKARGGTDDRANLQGLCRRCSNRKTASEGHAARRRANQEGGRVATPPALAPTPPARRRTAPQFEDRGVSDA